MKMYIAIAWLIAQLLGLPVLYAQPLVVDPSTLIAPDKPPVRALSDRFTDISSIAIETPAFAAKKNDFTSDYELATFIQRRIAPFANASWKSLGKTHGGRDVHLLIFTQDGRSDPLALAANRKPNVWIIAQQHGNEPAGAEAALEIARRLANTDLKQVLDKINVVIMPRANPDGAANSRRDTAKGDMNRDHMLMSLPETQMLHNALDAYPPAVVVDAHEFMAAGKWLERFNMVQASDVLFQSASHPGVADAVKRLTREVFDPALQATWAQYGLRSFPYHTLSIIADQTTISMGGNVSSIGRNTFGLYGAVSYLIETRGIGIGKEHYQRRVASHVLSMMTVLKTAAKHAEDLKALAKDTRKLNTTSTDWVVDYQVKTETRSIPMFDPITGEDKSLTIDFQNSLSITPTITRTIPLGYMLPSHHPVAARLKGLGINVHRLVNSAELEVETFVVKEHKADPQENTPNQTRVYTDLKRQKKIAESGSFWVPLNPNEQALWRIAMVALEPDSASSFATYKLLGDLLPGTELVIYRVLGVTQGNVNALQAPLLD